MVEAVAARQLPGCEEAIEKLDAEEVVRALEGLMKVEKVSRKKGGYELVYLYTPDEFTRKRLKVRLEVERGGGELVVRGRGAINLELVVRCEPGGGAAAAVTVHKGERYVSREALERIAEAVLDALAAHAPPAPAPTPAAPTPAPEVASPAAAEGLEERRPCEVRLFTAGLPVDEELSRRIPGELHMHANVAGTVVEEGRASVDDLDLSIYRDGFDVRIAMGDLLVETVRTGSSVGIHLRDTASGRELYGRDALREATERICRPGNRVYYIVIRVPL